MKKIRRTVYFIVVLAFLSIPASLFLFEAFADRFLPKLPEQFEKITPVSITQTPVMDAVGLVATLFPNLHYIGPADWEGSSQYTNINFQITTNQQGFWDERDFGVYHRKTKPNEFRIIVIGGSGAQGHGATSSQKRFSKLLETSLNGSQHVKTVSVFNMAMAGGEAVSLTPILRTWGHNVNPHLIIAYVGANDLYHIACGNGFQNRWVTPLTKHYISNPLFLPPDIEWVAKLFPNIVNRTKLLQVIKSMYYQAYYQNIAMHNIAETFGFSPKKSSLNRQLYEYVSKPIFIKSMKEIKRDF